MYLIRQFVFLFFLCYSNSSFADEIGMVTGSKTGTYIVFGQQIADALKKQGLIIKVKPSGGSVDNIQRMMSTENAALGFVQSDVMSYLLQSKNPKLKAAVKNLRMIAPFYNEEIHILASKKIHRLQDLEGKPVYIGPLNSGTNMTAHTIFNLLEINPKYIDIHNLSNQKNFDPYTRAIALLLTGKVEAIFNVSGKPTDIFSKKLKIVMQSDEKNLRPIHFLPLKQSSLLKNTPYIVSSLTHPAYEFINKGANIPTLAIKSMLISYDFSKGKSKYYRNRCKQIYTIFQSIKKNLNTLRKVGHEKWKNVNLDQNISLWKKSRCALYGGETKKRTNKRNQCKKIINSVKRLECLMN